MSVEFSKNRRSQKGRTLMSEALGMFRSFRKIELASGLSRASLRAWYEGSQTPTHGSLVVLRKFVEKARHAKRKLRKLGRGGEA